MTPVVVLHTVTTAMLRCHLSFSCDAHRKPEAILAWYRPLRKSNSKFSRHIAQQTYWVVLECVGLLDNTRARMQPQPPQEAKPIVSWASSFRRMSLSLKEAPQLDSDLEDLDEEDWSLPKNDVVYTAKVSAPVVAFPAAEEAPKAVGHGDSDSRRVLPPPSR